MDRSLFERIARYVSLDDLWSVLGYALLLGVSRLSRTPLDVLTVSMLAAGMLALSWAFSAGIRARNLERNPNARVVFWAAVAVASIMWRVG